jgi:hypothetical protein
VLDCFGLISNHL